MKHNPITSLERAFELAISGRFENAAEIRRQLKSEGYNDLQVTGPTLTRQLKALIAQHRKPISDQTEQEPAAD